MNKKKNKDDRKVLTLRYRIDENNHVSFIDPCCDEIPIRLFGNLMGAISDVEEEWNSTNEYQISKVQKIIKSLNDSDVYIEHIFLRGGCYRLFLFLKTIYPNAEPYIHQDKDHIVTKLFGHLFDIRGIIESEFECLYTPLSNEDLDMVESWSFSRNQVLQLCECPHCEEPIIYDEQYNIIEKG